VLHKTKNKKSDLWWHNLPRCYVGDLVAYKREDGKQFPLLVIEVNPEKPCRAHPCQSVLCSDARGKEKWFDVKKLEVISAARGSSET